MRTFDSRRNVPEMEGRPLRKWEDYKAGDALGVGISRGANYPAPAKNTEHHVCYGIARELRGPAFGWANRAVFGASPTTHVHNTHNSVFILGILRQIRHGRSVAPYYTRMICAKRNTQRRSRCTDAGLQIDS